MAVNLVLLTSAKKCHTLFLHFVEVKPSADSSLCAQQIRLAGGWNRCVGRVEVFYEGVWGTICDDQFGMNESQVVCKQLDCGNTTRVLGWSYFGNGSGPIMLDQVQCEGNEPAIWNCSHSDWYGSDCGHNEDISVICSVPSHIRLANGNRTCEGRVEVYHNGSWGTICDDLWNMLNAQVVCRQLSCGEAISADTDAKYGEGSGLILMDDVKCQGNETAVEECSHNGWGVSNCRHKEDAGVNCSGQDFTVFSLVSFNIRNSSIHYSESCFHRYVMVAEWGIQTYSACPAVYACSLIWEEGDLKALTRSGICILGISAHGYKYRHTSCVA
ncbi:scavenger receptor cysteine-rich domain-containing protein DMBT1-like [Paroedura picta]|uniref:scavenger receptor cysteine-rich domain-containing protein DMBT1-like n=1 Tax=Paroedura picta TaxID=143630 RepID=UPI0040564E81